MMKKKLILVRHATAEDQTMMIRDFERELVGKGKADAAAMGKWLKDNGVTPDRFVTSTAARALQTALIVAEQLKINSDEIVKTSSLYDGGPRSYLAAVNETPEGIDTLALFGHNPDITYFAEYLSGADIGNMSKCSIVILELDKLKWEEVSSKTAKFVSYTSPRQVREN